MDSAESRHVSDARKVSFAILVFAVVGPWLLGVWGIGLMVAIDLGAGDLWAVPLGMLALPVWVGLILVARKLDPEGARSDGPA